MVPLLDLPLWIRPWLFCPLGHTTGTLSPDHWLPLHLTRAQSCHACPFLYIVQPLPCWPAWLSFPLNLHAIWCFRVFPFLLSGIYICKAPCPFSHLSRRHSIVGVLTDRTCIYRRMDSLRMETNDRMCRKPNTVVD